jgi:hypothetical protein
MNHLELTVMTRDMMNKAMDEAQDDPVEAIEVLANDLASMVRMVGNAAMDDPDMFLAKVIAAAREQFDA